MTPLLPSLRLSAWFLGLAFLFVVGCREKLVEVEGVAVREDVVWDSLGDSGNSEVVRVEFRDVDAVWGDVERGLVRDVRARDLLPATAFDTSLSVPTAEYGVVRVLYGIKGDAARGIMRWNPATSTVQTFSLDDATWEALRQRVRTVLAQGTHAPRKTRSRVPRPDPSAASPEVLAPRPPSDLPPPH